MKRNLQKALTLLLTLCLAVSLAPMALAEGVSEQEAYDKIMAMQEQYPTGTPWTNENVYYWQGGIYSGGGGCAGFAFLLSDAAFGDARARIINDYAYEDLKVGDILRINNDTHSVVILSVYDDYVVIAEGNFNSCIYWGRTLTKDKVMESNNYIFTRYPEEADEAESDNASGFSDVADDSYCCGAVVWAVEQGITTGTSDTTFSPDDTCTRGQIITFLWRASGSPAPAEANSFSDVDADIYYADAAQWASEQGIDLSTGTFSPDAACTRAAVVEYLYRLAGSPEVAAATQFDDVSASDSFASAVAWAVEAGITTGTTETTFSPTATCTRGQIVTFLYRDMA
ncbi:MAG: S-layer homology domain-containing protein [Oscillospiraceae bacterium]|nr:S-layer homology domain-containing protein [Oscillospiraceae bacterium]